MFIGESVMTAKQKYRQLCKEDENIPIFSKDWWMDAVCGKNNWDALIVERGDDILASMPLFFKTKLGLKYVTVPKNTQTQGVHIRYPEGQKYEKRLGFEKQVMTEIIDQLEELGIFYFQQNFHYSLDNWQPFYWRAFKQTTRYTSVISDLTDLSQVFADFSKGARKDIRRAEKDAIVFTTEDLGLFYSLHDQVYERQGLSVSRETNRIIERIDSSFKQRNSRVMIAAKDGRGKVHSIVYLVWDHNSAYLLMSGTDLDLRDSNFKTLLVWEAIKYAARVTKKFDFEGSMIENIADYFRKFGGRLMPYYSISKAFRYAPLFELYRIIR